MEKMCLNLLTSNSVNSEVSELITYITLFYEFDAKNRYETFLTKKKYIYSSLCYGHLIQSKLLWIDTKLKTENFSGLIVG